MDSTIPSRAAKQGATLAYASLAIVMLLWAGNSIIGRAIRDDVAPFTLAFVRWLGAFLIVETSRNSVAPCSAPSPMSRFSLRLSRTAVANIGAARAGQTIALMPLIGASLASLLLNEPLHAYHLWGMALILSGLALGAWRGRAATYY